MSDPIVIVGGGLAAAKAVESLRSGGYDGPVTLIGAEPHLPYERPPLSKGYLTGEANIDDAFVHEPQWYYEHDVDLRLGTSVTSLDAPAHTVSTGDAEFRYSRLLLATGCSARRLPAADTSGAPVAYLRTIADSDQIRITLAGGGARLVVIGGGWLGLEIAASARSLGADITVVESADQPLASILGSEVGAMFAQLHRDHGVDLRLNTAVTSIERGTDGTRVRLDDDTVADADLVVVAVGATPNTALAERAGLFVENGIVVDAQLRTSDPDVFAAGDVAAVDHPRLGSRVRVEHWDNAQAQGEVAGANLAGGHEIFDRRPYFFTDQYDCGMEYVGHANPNRCEHIVIRGSIDSSATALWVADGQVAAGMHVNDWNAISALRALVGARIDLDRLRDTDVPLSELAAEASSTES